MTRPTSDQFQKSFSVSIKPRRPETLVDVNWPLRFFVVLSEQMLKKKPKMQTHNLSKLKNVKFQLCRQNTRLLA